MKQQLRHWSPVLGLVALLVIVAAVGFNAGVDSATNRFKETVSGYEERLDLVEARTTLAVAQAQAAQKGK